MSQPEKPRFPAPSESAKNQPDVLARLEQAVGQIQDSDTFRAYLDVQARFHRYSWANVALILAQRPDATRVAGYNAWLRMRRYVRRGEKAIKIVVPMTKRGAGENEDDERQLFFGTGNVFDISQTDGEPLPEVEVPVLTGEQGQELFLRLNLLAHQEGLSVRTGDPEKMPRELMGYYSPADRVILIKQAPMLQMTKTIAHELGHHFAVHAGGKDASTRPEQETVAESTAYVVCAHFGLDTGERSFPYIATWAKDRHVLREALGTIQKVSAIIIDRVEQRTVDERHPPEC